MTHQKLTVAVVLAVLMAVPAGAGVLQLGQANIQGNNVTIPIVLEGDVGSGVSAMDFTLSYDPAILEPVKVSTGSAADAADKNVQFNLTEPGRCKVVMMGLNQGVLSSGEVANVVMRRVSSNSASAELAVVDPTFADSGAASIPSQGSSQTIDFATQQPDNNTTQDPQQDSENPANPETRDRTPNSANQTDNTANTPGTDASDTSATSIADSAEAVVDLGAAFPALPQGVRTDGASATPDASSSLAPSKSAAKGAPGTLGAQSRLPLASRPGGASPGTTAEQPETPSAHPETPNGTSETTPPAIGNTDKLAMSTPGAVLPGLPAGTTSTNNPPSTAANPVPVAAPQGGFNVKWIGIGAIIVALLVLFAVRRRLFA